MRMINCIQGVKVKLGSFRGMGAVCMFMGPLSSRGFV